MGTEGGPKQQYMGDWTLIGLTLLSTIGFGGSLVSLTGVIDWGEGTRPTVWVYTVITGAVAALSGATLFRRALE